jgi:hypothetical protein
LKANLQQNLMSKDTLEDCINKFSYGGPEC